MPYLEHTVTFEPGRTGNFSDIQRKVTAAFGDLSLVALGAAQAEGVLYGDLGNAAGDPEPEYFEGPVGVGTATLDLLRRVTELSRDVNVRVDISGGQGYSLTTRICRRIGGRDSEAVAEVLVPTRREQGVAEVRIAYTQTREHLSGFFLGTTALHCSALLRGGDVNHPEAFITNVAMGVPRTVEESLGYGGEQALTVTVGNVYVDGNVMPDPDDVPPGFVYADRWARALDLLMQ